MTALYIFTDSEIKHTLTLVCFLEIKENLREISWQMFMSNKNNSSSLSDHEEAACSTVSSVTRVQDFAPLMAISSISEQHPDHKIKKRRNLPGNPDPDAEVIALSPKTLMATNRFVCEICKKGFQRDQNLQLHRRGHNLPWKLKQRNSKEMIKKKAYVCPEPTCVHNHPSRALGDLTGIKKHFCRKHGEKKWKCEKCSKIYAVQSDWKAHSKTCGTREYRCDCGTLFSRKDSFVTHRAFCDALAEESARLSAAANPIMLTSPLPLPPSSSSSSSNPINSQSFTIINQHSHTFFPFSNPPPPQIHLLPSTNSCWDNPNPNPIKPEIINLPPLSSPFYHQQPTHKNLNLITSPFLHVGSSQSMSSSAHLSATALLQKAATVGAQPVGHVPSSMMVGELSHVTSTGISPEYMGFASATWQKRDRLTRDFLGLTASEHGNGGGQNGNVEVDVNVRNLLTFTGGVGFPTYDRDHSLLKSHGFGFAEPPPPPPSETWGNC